MKIDQRSGKRAHLGEGAELDEHKRRQRVLDAHEEVLEHDPELLVRRVRTNTRKAERGRVECLALREREAARGVAGLAVLGALWVREARRDHLEALADTAELADERVVEDLRRGVVDLQTLFAGRALDPILERGRPEQGEL